MHCTTTPFHSIYQYGQSFGVRSSWEGRYTPSISPLPFSRLWHCLWYDGRRCQDIETKCRFLPKNFGKVSNSITVFVTYGRKCHVHEKTCQNHPTMCTKILDIFHGWILDRQLHKHEKKSTQKIKKNLLSPPPPLQAQFPHNQTWRKTTMQFGKEHPPPLIIKKYLWHKLFFM
jgi:hypothetical protein